MRASHLSLVPPPPAQPCPWRRSAADCGALTVNLDGPTATDLLVRARLSGSQVSTLLRPLQVQGVLRVLK